MTYKLLRIKDAGPVVTENPFSEPSASSPLFYSHFHILQFIDIRSLQCPLDFMMGMVNPVNHHGIPLLQAIQDGLAVGVQPFFKGLVSK